MNTHSSYYCNVHTYVYVYVQYYSEGLRYWPLPGNFFEFLIKVLLDNDFFSILKFLQVFQWKNSYPSTKSPEIFLFLRKLLRFVKNHYGTFIFCITFDHMFLILSGVGEIINFSGFRWNIRLRGRWNSPFPPAGAHAVFLGLGSKHTFPIV